LSWLNPLNGRISHIDEDFRDTYYMALRYINEMVE